MKSSEQEKHAGSCKADPEQDSDDNSEKQWITDGADELKAFMESYALNYAASGSTKQARNNLKSIAERIENDDLDGIWKKWLILALREISEGGDPRKILMTSGRKGKDPERENKIWHRNRAIYFYLQRIKKASPDITKSDACADLLDKLGMTADPPVLDIDAVREVHNLKTGSDEELLSLFSGITSTDAIAKAYDRIAKEQLDLHKGTIVHNGVTLVNQTDHRPLFRKRK